MSDVAISNRIQTLMGFDFGTQRIGIAPWFIFIGLVLPIVAIMMKRKES